LISSRAVSRCVSATTKTISNYGSAPKKVSSVCNNTGRPSNNRNCLGTVVPIRTPEPPATMIAYFFIGSFCIKDITVTI
jgi:hypothetical protein